MNDKEVKDEKHVDTLLIADADSDVDFRDKDEALRLVGLERTAVFTEEYYAKLRRKMVMWLLPIRLARVNLTLFNRTS